MRSAGTAGRHSSCVAASLLAIAGVASVARAELPPGCSELNLALTDHTCFHARFGPFEERVASDGASPGPTTPAIDATHTHFRVALTPERTQLVTFTPARSGSWAVFVDPDVPLTIRSPSGPALAPLLRHEISADDCPFLRRVAVSSGRSYALELDGLRDVSGNALDDVPTLEDAALDFAVDAPQVVWSSPYPRETFYAARYLRHPDGYITSETTMSVRFDRPMSTSSNTVVLKRLDSDEETAVVGTWTPDLRQLDVRRIAGARTAGDRLLAAV
jgi:hypothetical protein